MLILKLVLFGLAVSSISLFPTSAQVRAMSVRKAWAVVVLMYAILISGIASGLSLVVDVRDSFRSADPVAVWQALEDYAHERAVEKRQQRDAEQKTEIEK